MPRRHLLPPDCAKRDEVRNGWEKDEMAGRDAPVWKSGLPRRICSPVYSQKRCEKHRFFDERKENEWILTESEGLEKTLAKVSFGSSSKKRIYRLCQNGISFFHAQENAVAELFALCKHPEGVVTPGKGINMADQRKNL